MKILLVGSGGREHALGLGLHADPECTELHVAPGNPGIAQFAKCHPLAITDNQAILDLAQKLDAELVVIGPEVPLVNGPQIFCGPLEYRFLDHPKLRLN